MESGLPLYRAEQVRELDRIAIEMAGIPGYTLMSRAGEVAFETLRSTWPEARRLAVVCGTGNNGGDGYVVGRLALEAGMDAIALQLGDSQRIRGDARTALEDFLSVGGTVSGFDQSVFRDVDVIVDAILGTGLERPLEGEWREAVEALNRVVEPVLAVDIPTGLHADTGMVLGSAVMAACTVTFIGRKQGLFTGQAPLYTGPVYFSELQVPDSVYQQVPVETRLLEHAPLGALALPRPRTAHKGNHGHVLVIGGDHGMSGAVRLAGEAAARVGAGLVSVATRQDHAAIITAGCPELMCHGVEQISGLNPLLQRASVVVIGPGLGQSPWANDLLTTVLESDLPLVVDADALNMLASRPIDRGGWIITPHPGEAARLLGVSTASIESNRYSAIDELVARYHSTTVLKGAGTLISAGGHIAVCRAGNPGMACGGMGDVLSGVIAGLVAQGLDLPQAAEAGVCIHAAAGDSAARDGERGLMPSDVLLKLRTEMNPDRR